MKLTEHDHKVHAAQVASKAICDLLFPEDWDDDDSEFLSDYDQIAGYCQDYFIGDEDINVIVDSIASVYGITEDEQKEIFRIFEDASKIAY